MVPVPDSGVAAAIGYSSESLACRSAFGLIRNHYVGRTFIEPEQRVRDFGVKLKLNPVRSLLTGKRSDPGGRFDRPRHYQPQDRPHGARRRRKRSSRTHLLPTNNLTLLITAWTLLPRAQLIGANKTIEEIREYIGADSLAYLSLDGLQEACAEGEKTTYCTSCYTGLYPTEFVPLEHLIPAAVPDKKP